MKTKAIRIIEREVYDWPKVHRKEDASVRHYYAGERQFAYIEKDLLILIQTTPEERRELTEKWGAEPYEDSWGKKIGFLLQIPLDADNATQLIPYLKSSYDHALKWKGV